MKPIIQEWYSHTLQDLDRKANPDKKKFIASGIEELENFTPPIKDNFWIDIELSIGTKGSKGSDIFIIDVCTPKGFMEYHERTKEFNVENVFFISSVLLVYEYDFSSIREKIESFVDSIEGDSWLEIANKLSKKLSWEFDENG